MKKFGFLLVLASFDSVALAIKISDDVPSTLNQAGFQVYWNVPTHKCTKLQGEFESLANKFGILINKGEHFRGELISLLYDPGKFPYVTKNDTHVTIHNGGIPQAGNLSLHLKKLEDDLNRLVNETTFAGLGIIDFEHWRPIFRQNWNLQVIYRNMSFNRTRLELCEKDPKYQTLFKDEKLCEATSFDDYRLHMKDCLNKTTKKKECADFDKLVNQTAQQEFEKNATDFMLQTILKTKDLRQNGKWGYYGFPYCYNFRNGNTSGECPEIAKEENNRTTWLFNASQALYPSLYLEAKYNESQHIKLMVGILNEAYRVSNMVPSHPPTYPYVWFRYIDNDTYLTKEDANNTFALLKLYSLGGGIIWGKSEDVNDETKCTNLKKYLEDTLGPIIQSINKSTDLQFKKGQEFQ